MTQYWKTYIDSELTRCQNALAAGILNNSSEAWHVYWIRMCLSLSSKNREQHNGREDRTNPDGRQAESGPEQ